MKKERSIQIYSDKPFPIDYRFNGNPYKPKTPNGAAEHAKLLAIGVRFFRDDSHSDGSIAVAGTFDGFYSQFSIDVGTGLIENWVKQNAAVKVVWVERSKVKRILL